MKCQELGKSWHGGELMHGRRGNYPPTSPDYAPRVSIYIVEAVESRGMRRHAVPPPRIRGGLRANSGLASEPALFLEVIIP